MAVISAVKKARTERRDAGQKGHRNGGRIGLEAGGRTGSRQDNLHGPLTNGLKYFRFWLRFRRVIQILKVF